MIEGFPFKAAFADQRINYMKPMGSERSMYKLQPSNSRRSHAKYFMTSMLKRMGYGVMYPSILCDLFCSHISRSTFPLGDQTSTTKDKTSWLHTSSRSVLLKVVSLPTSLLGLILLWPFTQKNLFIDPRRINFLHSMSMFQIKRYNLGLPSLKLLKHWGDIMTT